MRERSVAGAILAAVWWLGQPVPAEAHKLKAFASVEGASIIGYAYFSPGGRVHQATVTVLAPDGAEVARLATDDQGNFRFEATRRIDYRITVDGGDGHVASYTVPAGELPETLPGADGAPPLTAPAAAVATSPAPAAVSAAATAPPACAAGAEPADLARLRAVIDQSVSHQLRPLREQIDGWQEKIALHDVLGGLGVIFGLGGLAYGLAQRRRQVPKSEAPT